MRPLILILAAASLTLLSSAGLTTTAAATEMTVYKDPNCGCCANWIKHMEAAGYRVKTVNSEDMDRIKAEFGVPEPAQSCHTAVVDGYVLEGHVPAADVDRLLAERPQARGLAVPGMPAGSPGMEMPGTQADAYDVILFDANQGKLFSRY